MDNIHVDKEGLCNQLYENNRSGKGYLELKAIIPEIENEENLHKATPIIKMDRHNVSAVEIGLLILCLEETIKGLMKMPQVEEAYEYCNKRIKNLTSTMIKTDKK